MSALIWQRETIQPINASFDDVVNAIVPRAKSEEIASMNNKINILTPSKGKMEITSKQGVLDLGIERERDVEGIGMGALSDGTPYLSQRGLASLCGVQNAHIGTISSQWDDEVQKPRITTIKGILNEAGSSVSRPHIEVFHKGVVHFCYPADVCLAVLEYYALDAGSNVRPEALRKTEHAGDSERRLIVRYAGQDRNRPQWVGSFFFGEEISRRITRRLRAS